MAILIDKSGSIQDDWAFLQDGEAATVNQKVIVPIARWLAEREQLRRNAQAVGVVLDPTSDVAGLLPDLEALDLIAIQFSVFSDGRGFSQARLLRERLGYGKDIRAIGDVLRDQLTFMARCGINQFAVENEQDVRLTMAAFWQISVGYQADMLQVEGGK